MLVQVQDVRHNKVKVKISPTTLSTHIFISNIMSLVRCNSKSHLHYILTSSFDRPLLLAPSTVTVFTFLTLVDYLICTWPYHYKLSYLNFSMTYVTPNKVLSVVSKIMVNKILLHINNKNLISATSIFLMFLSSSNV